MSIVIPLGEQTIDIINDGNTYSNNDIINMKKVKSDNKKYIMYILIGVDVLILLFILSVIFKMKPKERKYEKKLKKIFKTYDQAIVILNKKPDLSIHEVIEIFSFEEMLDARENFNKPILSYRETNGEEKCYFIIINENQAYFYILKPED